MRTHVDLFSGIGGFALACRWAGVQTVAFAEIDDYASRVLAKNFPGVTNYGDIRNVPPTDNVWLVTGGFPCQPFSVAGKQRGADDDRWLWPEMAACIERIRPRWVLAENVPGIVNMELDTVLSDLEAIDYTTWAVVVPAVAVDAPHRRDRVWIVAHTERTGTGNFGRTAGGQERRRTEAGAASLRQGNGQTCTDGIDATSTVVAHADATERRAHDSARQRIQGRNDADSIPGRQEISGRSQLCGAEDVAHADSDNGIWRGGNVQVGRQLGQGTVAPDGDAGRTERQPEPRLVRVADGIPAGMDGAARWQPEPDIPRIASGVADRVNRLKGLGNAIVPQVAYQLIRMMIEVEQEARHGQR